MPRQIILYVCLAFIFYVLRMDAKRKPDVSYALWLPCLSLAIISSRPVSFWFSMGVVGSSPDYYLEGSPFDRNISIILIFAAIIILRNRITKLPDIIKNNKYIFIYIFYLLLSTLWSDYTFISFKRWIKELGTLLIVFIILTESHPIEAIKTIFRRVGYLVIPLSIVFNKYFPAIGRMWSQGGGEAQYTGVTTSKNYLGIVCLVYGLFFFWNFLILWRNRKTDKNIWEIFIHLFYLVMIGSLLYTANSATAMLATIIGVVIIIAFNVPSIKNNVKSIKYYALFLLLIMTILHLSFGLTEQVTSSLGRNETLTGRTQVWEEVLAMETNPFIGTGYASFWLGERAEYFWNKYWWHPTQAHNGYLEEYLNTGFIGLFIIFCFVYTAYRNINNKLSTLRNYDYHVLRATFWIIFLLVNITEAYFRGIIWFVFLLIAIGLPETANSINANSDKK